jgi:hypothetical protein
MSRWGPVCLLGCSALVGGCESVLVGTAEPADNLAEFEAAWAWVDSVYPAFEMKGIDWDAEYLRFRPLAEAARGDEIVQVLNDMLAVLEDSHLYYETLGGGVVFPHLSPRLLRDRHAFSAHLLRDYFPEALLVSSDGTFEYQILDGNLGYVRIATFDRDRMISALPDVMEFVRHTDALIIDVRNNNGGDSENVDGVVSRFIDAPLRWMDAYEQDGVPFQPWPTIEPDPVLYRYANPVVVLVNGASLSAAEVFPEVMKRLPNVTAVGDTTAGGGCNDYRDADGDRHLPSGRVIHIPTACVGRYEGGLIEWNGVAPDLRVAMSSSDIQAGNDVQLEAAIRLLQGGLAPE